MDKYKKWKKMIPAVLIITLAASLAACGEKEQQAEKKGSAQNSNAPKGRYVEQEIKFDDTDIFRLSSQTGEEGITQDDMILEMKGLDNGNLRIAARTGIFDSADKGKTWEPWQEMPQEMKEDLSVEYGIEFLAISGDGKIFYATKGEQSAYKLVQADGSIQTVSPELPAENTDESGLMRYVENADYTDSGDIIYRSNENICQLDGETLKLKHTYSKEAPQGEEIMDDTSYVCTGDSLFMILREMNILDDGNLEFVNTKVTEYDLKTQEEKGEQEALGSFLQDALSGLGVSIPGADGKSLYFINQSGIFRFMTDGTAAEKIFTGSMGQMNSPVSSVVNAAVLTDGTVFIHYYIDGKERMFRYVYDANASVRPEHTLTVYSLYDTPYVRQFITAFQSEHPDVMVEYETGMTGEDAVTRTDALKTLNTNIMAGEGPDILMLDGMPISSYTEKGLLLDIQDLLKETDKKEGIFTNITGAYEEDGAICAVPTSFAVPLLIGKQSILSKIESLDDLALAAEQERANRPEVSNVLGTMTNTTLLLALLPSSSPSWIAEDGTMDKEKLTDFFENAKKIADAQNAPDVYESPLISDTQPLDITPFMTSATLTSLEIGYTDSHITLGNLMKVDGLANVLAMTKYLGDGSYKTTPGQSANVFIPMAPVGISSKTGSGEIAKDFIRYLLKEGQRSSALSSWPVNKTAFADKLELPSNYPLGMHHMESDVDGSGYDMEFFSPTEEEINTMKDMMETLATPAVTDEMINRTVITEGIKCLSGEASVSNSVDAVLKKLNLYLAE